MMTTLSSPLLPRVSVLAIGSELLDGRVGEGNTRTTALLLRDLGLAVHRVMWCDDDIGEICAALEVLSSSSEFVVVSGGLGPTTDDKTREAVARFLGVALRRDDLALEDIKAFLMRRGRPFVHLNERQAFIPEGSERIANLYGTAPGFLVPATTGRGVIVSLPGVPREFEPLFKEEVLPRIAALIPEGLRPSRLQFTIYGLAESEVGMRIESLGLPERLIVSYRPHFPEIFVTVKVPAGLTAGRGQFRDQLLEALGPEHVVTADSEDSLPRRVHRLLADGSRTLSCAESCTGGLLSSLLTAEPGSSSYFQGAAVAYSNAVKETVLGVPRTILDRYGAVSAECAESLAEGARKVFATDYALSITGIAGPTGATEGKPVGTVFIGLACGEHVRASRHQFAGDRDRIQRGAAFAALYRLWREALSG